jgi:peptidoglycan/LPS O-acetylase OafA/YrhL
MGRERLETVEALRGLAAMMVVMFHLCVGSGQSVAWLRTLAGPGWLGYDIFFVISGFIIPYSMHRGGYVLRDAPVFAAKRLLRLEPPYLLSIALVVALNAASARVPGFAGQPVHVDATQILLHLGYLNVFVGRPWLNPVFWTLAIEFQFYLSMMLVFPLLAARSRPLRLAALAGLAALAFVPGDQFLMHYLGLFGLGIVTFQMMRGIEGRLASLALMAAFTVLNAMVLTSWVAGAGLLTALAIAFVRLPRIAPIAFFGAISYSIYLLHVPIGGRVMNLGLRFAHTAPAQVALVALAVAVSTAAAYIFYRLVEAPCQRLSGRLKYRGARQAQPASA